MIRSLVFMAIYVGAAAVANAGSSTLDAAIGGGVGGAAGAAIGNEVGGREGAIAGSALGATGVRDAFLAQIGEDYGADGAGSQTASGFNFDVTIAGSALGAAVGTAINTGGQIPSASPQYTTGYRDEEPRHGHPHYRFCPPGQAKKGRC